MTYVLLMGQDMRTIHKLDFIFGDIVNSRDSLSVAPQSWNYDSKGIMNGLRTTECHYPLYYFESCTKEIVMS